MGYRMRPCASNTTLATQCFGGHDQRVRFAEFWLSCPEDQLEMLWKSNREVCCHLIRHLTLRRSFPLISAAS